MSLYLNVKITNYKNTVHLVKTNIFNVSSFCLHQEGEICEPTACEYYNG